jgi:hypothetical protein
MFAALKEKETDIPHVCQRLIHCCPVLQQHARHLHPSLLRCHKQGIRPSIRLCLVDFGPEL